MNLKIERVVAKMTRSNVKLLLEPGTRILNWIRYQNLNVMIGRELLNKRTVRFLKIRGGKAYFIPSGSVAVVMPGSDQHRVAFQKMKVLEIQDFKNTLIERNHYLCTKCSTLTGKMESSKLSGRAGLMDANFKCTRCGNQWELKRI